MPGDGITDVVGDGGSSHLSEMEAMRVAVEARLDKYSVPTKLPKSQFSTLMARIDAKFNAKTKEQKEAVKNDLTYLAIVHGAGPNVEWSDIIARPDGCIEVNMAEIVDHIVTRRYWRRFLVNFSARAVLMHDSSPELQAQLKDRAIRNGLPVTETMAVIDFLDNSMCSSGQVAARTSLKYSAVKRANSAGVTSMEKAAQGARSVVQGTEDTTTMDF